MRGRFSPDSARVGSAVGGKVDKGVDLLSLHVGALCFPQGGKFFSCAFAVRFHFSVSGEAA